MQDKQIDVNYVVIKDIECDIFNIKPIYVCTLMDEYQAILRFEDKSKKGMEFFLQIPTDFLFFV